MLPSLLLLTALFQQPSGDHALCQGLVESGTPDARARVEAALRDRPATPARAAFLQGCQALAAERWEPAVASLERAVAAADANATYHLWLGRALGEQAQRAGMLRKLGLARRVRDHLLRAVQLEPGNIDARQYLIEFYIQAPSVAGGSVGRAAEQVEEIRRRSPYHGALTGAALAVRRGDGAAAEREYASLVRSHPDSVTPVLGLANLFYRARRWDDAAALARRLQQARPNSRLAQYLTGRNAAESGQNLDAGEQALRQYLTHRPVRDEPALASAHWRLGMVLQHQGDRDGARREYQAALGLNPRLSGAREALNRLR